MMRQPYKLLLADDFVMTVAEGTLYNKAQMVASVADKSYRPVRRCNPATWWSTTTETQPY